jgi:hypothetical protein
MIEVKPNITDEAKLIPWWAIGLAVLLFAGIQVLMHVVLFRLDPHPAPLINSSRSLRREILRLQSYE